MILGASKIGVLTAERLQGKYNVTLIEQNEEKANKIALKLKNTLVIHGDGTDVSLLEEQSIDDMDAFIAVTGDSETNIISSLVAKSHGVRKTISGVENVDYIKLSHNIGIDTLINKKVIAANDILRYIRKGEVNAIATLSLDAEVIEFTVKANSKIVSIHTKFPITDRQIWFLCRNSRCLEIILACSYQKEAIDFPILLVNIRLHLFNQFSFLKVS